MKNFIDFSTKPEKIHLYNFGDVVTRENFIHFLILSYAVSRGSFIIQKVFFIMTDTKIGFPYEVIIENFYTNGSFKNLSTEEQEIFIKAFRGVSKHLKEYEEIEILDEISDEVDGLYDRPKDDGADALNITLQFFDFNQIHSVNDFLKTASEFKKRLKDN